MGSSANPPTSLSIAQRGLNLNEDQLMEQAVQARLKSQPVDLEKEEEDAIQDAKFRSLVGKRRNTARSSNERDVITIDDDDGGGGKMSAEPLCEEVITIDGVGGNIKLPARRHSISLCAAVPMSRSSYSPIPERPRSTSPHPPGARIHYR